MKRLLRSRVVEALRAELAPALRLGALVLSVLFAIAAVAGEEKLSSCCNGWLSDRLLAETPSQSQYAGVTIEIAPADEAGVAAAAAPLVAQVVRAGEGSAAEGGAREAVAGEAFAAFRSKWLSVTFFSTLPPAASDIGAGFEASETIAVVVNPLAEGSAEVPVVVAKRWLSDALFIGLIAQASSDRERRAGKNPPERERPAGEAAPVLVRRTGAAPPAAGRSQETVELLTAERKAARRAPAPAADEPGPTPGETQAAERVAERAPERAEADRSARTQLADASGSGPRTSSEGDYVIGQAIAGGEEPQADGEFTDVALPPDAVQVAAEYEPEMSPEAEPSDYDRDAFGSDPTYEDKPYDSEGQIEIYGGKYRLDEPRPVVEIGRPLYTEGPFREGVDAVGEKNLGFAHLQAYGDLRTAVAYNDNGDVEQGLVATRLNLDVDLKLTATERIHAFVRPFDEDGDFSSYIFAGDDAPSEEVRLDAELETLFFEGDAGSIYAGLTDDYATFDLPFTFGLVPFLFQNGIWVEDAFWGAGFAIPARNSPMLDISNMDITFFAGFDEVTTPAVKAFGDVANHDVHIYGTAIFAEVLEGYLEAGYGYTQGFDNVDDFDYHNATVAFTRRYGGWLSNSVRVVGAFGQDREDGADKTANGVIFLVENSLITDRPLTLVPYFNAWFGYDRPVPLAREDGILKNTGINFETDGLTGFPKLDDSGQDTYGGALGVEYLFNLDQQIVFELAALQVMGGDNGRPAPDDQYAVGLRYQIPLTNAWILRADAMYGLLQNQADVAGARMELRLKF